MKLKNLLGIGREALLNGGTATAGTVVSVKKQYWLKVNTKSVRRSALDGAVFPAIVTVQYRVKDTTYTAKLWSSPRAAHPLEGSAVTVYYDPEQPQHCASRF